MGFFKKITKPFKKVAEAVTKPFAKLTNKLIPNELRFLAPYAAGIGTLMLPPGMGPYLRAMSAMGLNTAGQIASDESATGDIDDINKFSAALSGGLGYLGADAVTQGGESGMGVRGGIEQSSSGAAAGTNRAAQDLGMNQSSVGFMQGAENVGREGVASLSDFVQGNRQTLSDVGSNPGDLFSSANKFKAARDVGKALGATTTLGTGDVAYEAAIDAQDAYEQADLEEQRQMDETTTADESERADFSMRFNREAGNSEEVVKETLRLNGLEDYYEPPVEAAANGGIMGRANFALGGLGGRLMGGLGNTARMINNTPQGLDSQMEAASRIMNNNLRSNSSQGLNSQMEAAAKITDKTEMMRPGMIDAQAAFEPKQADEFIEAIRNPNTGGIDYKMAEMKLGTKLKGDETLSQLISMYLYSIRKDKLGMAAITAGYGGLGVGAMANNSYANGGITGLKDGGMLNFGGREMDLRTGGFVPIGRKERADDVPARLSKNEFVMTADAVKAAGGGSVNEGAKRMYEVMNNLEARA